MFGWLNASGRLLRCAVFSWCATVQLFEYLFAERAILDSSLRLWQWDAAGRESEERHCETESGCQAGLSRRSHRGHGRVRACGNQSGVVRESSPLATGRANGKRGIERRMRGWREMERCVCVCLCVYFCVCGWECAGCTSGILSVTAAAMLCPVLLLEGFTVWLVCSEKAHHALCNVLMVVCIGRVLSWVSLGVLND